MPHKLCKRAPAAAAAAAAAAAKSLQLCPTLCDPKDGSLPGSSIPRILQARTLEWVAISFSNAWKWKVKVKSLSRVRLFETPWTTAYQAPPSMGFSRQETSTKIKSWPLQLPTFNTPERSSGWKSGMRHSVLWERLAEQAFRYLGLFSTKFYKPQFLHLLIPRETLTSLMVTSALAIMENFTLKVKIE